MSVLGKLLAGYTIEFELKYRKINAAFPQMIVFESLFIRLPTVSDV